MKRCICLLLVLSVLLAATCSAEESFFPQLSDLYGIELPSLGELTMSNPMYTEDLLNGSTLYIYDLIGESYYSWCYTWGRLLEQAGCSLVDSNVENGIFSAVIGKDDLTIYFLYDVLTGQAAVIYPKGSYPKKLEYCRDVVWIGEIDNVYVQKTRDAETLQVLKVKKVTLPEKIPLRWYVLEKDGDKAYVVSAKSVDERAFSLNKDSVWENSEIRNWLNTEFFDQSFTQEEKSAILPVSYESIKYGWGEKDQSEEQYTTEDRVVLLSRKDVEKMPGGLCYGLEKDNFILRDTSSSNVCTEGAGYYSQDRECPIHPAMWVDLSKLESSMPDISSSLYDAAKGLAGGI